MGKRKSYSNDGSIEHMVKKVLKDGDLSKLKDLGPLAQSALDTFVFGSRKGGDDIPHSTPYSTTQGNAQPSRGPSAQTPPPHSYYPPSQTRSAQVVQPPRAQSVPQRSNKRLPRGLPEIILGSLGVAVFGLAALLLLIISATITVFVNFAVGMVLAAICGGIALVSAVFLARGISKYKLATRASQLINVLQSKKVYAIDELAAAANMLPKQVKRDLRKIRAKGLVPEIYTDAEESYVMWGRDTYEQYLASEETRQQKLREEESRKQRLGNPATADIERFRSEGNAIVQKIRTANDAIPGEGISAKLDTLEDTVKRIITYVERYPEKLPDTRKFMDHYLPITLRLVDKYHQYDGMDFEPENVRQAKEEIERSMDTINGAFNNLLESLFAHDTMDVATDIVVLEKMLEQEGLTGTTFKIDPPRSA